VTEQIELIFVPYTNSNMQAPEARDTNRIHGNVPNQMQVSAVQGGSN